jgi:hypothetical protein
MIGITSRLAIFVWFILLPAQAFSAESLSDWIKAFNKNHPFETGKIKKAVNDGSEARENEFSKEYKELLFKIYTGYANKISAAKSIDTSLNRDTPLFEFFRKALGKLEHREDEVDATADRVKAHLSQLEERRYRIRWRGFIHYMSWQSQASLKGPFERTSLLTTNLGFCPGIGASLENRFWALSVDLSGLYGSGGVSAIQGLVEYQQSQVPAFGGRFSLGIGKIVSPTGSEVGLRGSALYVRQNLTRPSDPAYSVEQNKTLSFTLSLFSRWRFGHLYLETDFGRTIARPSTIWSIGLGGIL